MKVLLINQTFFPDIVSTAQHLTDLALGLVERGHSVTVVTGRRGYDQQDRLFAKEELWRGIQTYRVASTSFGKGAKWRRAVDFGTFILSSAIRLFTLSRPDAIVALTSPPLVSFLAAVLSKLRRCPYFYWVMDLNPDEAVAAGWLRPESLLARLLEAMSRFSLRHATCIFALDRFAKDRILSKGIPASQVAVIAPWSHDDAVKFDADGRTQFRKEHGLEGKFVVMYSGNHSPCHPLTTLLEAARLLDGPQDHPQPPTTNNGQLITNNQPPITNNEEPITTLTFVFIGGGSGFGDVQRFVEEHRLDNVRCLPYQPLDQLAGSLSAADLHVVAMGDPFVGIIHPCKIYNILQVGAPVLYIGPAVSHITEILNELPDTGHWSSIRHGDVPGIVAAVTRAMSRPSTELVLADAANRAVGESLPGAVSEQVSVEVATAQDRASAPSVAAQFSKDALLPQMIGIVEHKTEMLKR